MLLITTSSALRCSVSFNNRCVSSKRRAFSSALPRLAATVVIYVVVVAFVLITFSTGQKTHNALCTFRTDLQHRVAMTPIAQFRGDTQFVRDALAGRNVISVARRGTRGRAGERA